MLSYNSLQKKMTQLIDDIYSRRFSSYTNHLLTKEDTLFLDKKMLLAEKIVTDIESLKI